MMKKDQRKLIPRRLTTRCYFWMVIELEDQEKTTFMCLFGTVPTRGCLLAYAMLLPPFRDACLASSVIW
ncbi:hypothetical protein AAG906_028302 [Vitis piasezkii]